MFDKNEVIVYNVLDKSRVFRSIFRDATAIVSRLFYVTDFEDDIDLDEDEEEGYSRFKDDEIMGDE